MKQFGIRAGRKNIVTDESGDFTMFLIAGFVVGALVALFVPPGIGLILVGVSILALFIKAFDAYKLSIAAFLGAMIFVTLIRIYIWQQALGI